MKKTVSIFSLITSAAMVLAITVTPASSFAAHYDDGIRAYWNMDEGAGTNADEQAHNLDGTLTNGTAWGSSAPVIGSTSGLSFDGVDDYVSVAHDSELDMTGAYSISAFVNVTDVATYRPILFRGMTDSNDIEVYVQSGTGDLIVAHNRGNSGTFDFVGFDNPPVGSYFHLAVTFNGTDVMAYYNGVAATVVQGTTAMTAPLDTDNGWWMGKVDHAVFGGTFYFNGLMDEVRIYDRALSATEVSRLNDYGTFTLDVTPDSDTNPLGSDHTVTITLDTPLSFIPVLYNVSSNAAPGEDTQYIYTDENGQIIFTYTGVNAGTDTIIACMDVSWFFTGGGVCDAPFDEPSDSATKTWVQTYEVSGMKYQDSNANGTNDGEDPLSGWTIFIDLNDNETLDVGEQSTTTDGAGQYTFDLADGTYDICEVVMPSWVQTEPGIPSDPACYGVVVAGSDMGGNDFGNVHLIGTDGKTKGFWTNKNGEAEINNDGGDDDELAMLMGLNLRKEDGSDFDPTTYPELKAWLKKARAVNMAYMLSVQLASAELAVEAEFLDPNTMIYAPELIGSLANETATGFITIGELMDAANDELDDHGTASETDPWWAYQNALKAVLDAVNSGAAIAVEP